MKHSLVFLVTGLEYGGAETQLVRITTELKSRGWDIKIISLLPPQAFVSELGEMDIPVETLNMRPGKPSLRALTRTIKLLHQWRPEIVVSFMYHANLLNRMTRHLGRVRVCIASIRNENFGGHARDILMRLTDRLGTFTTTNSHLAKNALIDRRVVPVNRISVIPNGIVTSKFTVEPTKRSQLRQALDVRDGTFIWLAVGRLELQKDYPNLLTALSYLKHDLKVCIAGQGPLLENLKVDTERLDLSGRVHFLGLRKDIPELLSAADALVLSSAWEGLPNVVMEALAAAKPVVATNVGGVTELVQDGVSGFVVPPQNPRALAAAMEKTMHLTLDERTNMGHIGKQFIAENLDLKSVVDRWEALFFNLLRKEAL